MRFQLGVWGTILAAASLVQADDASLPGIPAGIDPALVRQTLLEKFDADGDGKLNGQELQNARAALTKQFGAGFGQAGAVFDEFKKKFDRDGDGKLNREEQAAAMAAFQKARGNGAGPVSGDLPAGGLDGGSVPEGKVRSRDTLIKRFDKNGDGKLDDEEKAEAQKALKLKKGERPGGKLTEALKKFDADGDGKLSDEEKAAVKKELSEKRKEKGKKPE